MQIKNPTLIESKNARWVVYFIALVVIATLLSNKTFSFSDNNGFDLTDPLIPREKIHHGGPARDGIPSIDKPRFISVNKASYLNAQDRILGLVYDDVIHAYPIKILNYHEIVNDHINGQAIVISYCPLCGSGMAFKPAFASDDNSFGVSGLLYNSDMLLYDRKTESLWSQIMGTAISGRLKGTKLETVQLVDTSWENWIKQHPQTKVLSNRTGYFRNYDKHPYGDYNINAALYFPINNTNARYHPKERVIGITIKDKHKVYPFSELAKQGKAIFNDKFAGQTLQIHYDGKSQSAMIFDAGKRQLTTTTLFWFAWAAFHPDTDVYTVKK